MCWLKIYTAHECEEEQGPEWPGPISESIESGSAHGQSQCPHLTLRWLDLGEGGHQGPIDRT